MIKFFREVFMAEDDELGVLLGLFVKWSILGCMIVVPIALTVKLFQVLW